MRSTACKSKTPAKSRKSAPQWTFQTNVVNKFEATPLVVDGVLYVTGALNHAWAIDARTGRQIWHYQRQLPQGLKVCCAGRARLSDAGRGYREDSPRCSDSQ